MQAQATSLSGAQTDSYSRLDLFKPNWYIEQFKGWTRTSYTLLVVGLLTIALTTFLDFKHGVSFVGLTQMSALTWLAASLGFTCTLAITNAKPMNGVLGLVSAIIYIIMALEAKNPADAMLQGFYILALDIPVLIMPSWAKNVDHKIRFIHETKIRGEKHSPAFWYTLIALVAVGAFLLAFWFETSIIHLPNRTFGRTLADSFVLGTGMAGAILTTLRFSESGIAWVVQGVAQVILWGITASSGEANWVLFATYAMYVANDLIIIFQSKWFHHKQITESLAKDAYVSPAMK